jgi:hypothetical protein
MNTDKKTATLLCHSLRIGARLRFISSLSLISVSVVQHLPRPAFA